MIKKIISTLFLYLIAVSSTTAQDQSLNETVSWLTKVIKIHSYYSTDIEFRHSDSVLIVKTRGVIGLTDNYETAKVKDLIGITFTSIPNDIDFIEATILCGKGDCVDLRMKEANNPNSKYTLQKATNLWIPFKGDTPNDIKVRLEKAINHLIELCGGETLDDTF